MQSKASHLPKAFTYTWDYLFGVALQHKKELIIAHIIAILATIASVPVPLLMPLLVDEVLLKKPGITVRTIDYWVPADWQTPVVYISVVLFASLLLRVISIAFNIVQARQFTLISKDIVYRIRHRLINHLQTISMAEYESLGSGSVVTHLVTDLDTIDNFIGSTISRLLVAILTIMGTAVILLWMHWQLGLFILLLNPLVIYFTRTVGSRVKDLKNRENSAYEIFQQALTETLEAIHQIRASNRERHYCHLLVDAARTVKEQSGAFAWKSDAASRLSFLVFLFGFDVFRATAMLMVFYSDLSIGEMLAVFGYLWFMMAPVQEVLGIQYAYFAAKAALARINRLTKLQQEPQYPHLNNPFKNKKSVSIRVENLHFSYTDEPILNNINLTIKAGEKVALVGASGGGKSTLVQTLIGLYSPSAGTIYYDNIPIERIGLEVVREHVVTVLQHPILFNDTIRANLTMGKQEDDSVLWQALDIAQMKEIVSDLPLGLDTVIGRHGMRLSGGQRQRMAIARMVTADPKVVILDEATSALDSATEYQVHHALNDFLKNRTTIIIAHRLSAVKQADHVYVFEEGTICEQGRHDILIQQKGLYAKLYGEYQ
ncbi:MAG: ABC transporter ATP-binding protein [Methylicorpusculum sp.]|uniref:ABC transporter ATP-binding protein n=1 Tax=Methylicorpusculum sp. TaxID=2713644 RepID=UPI002721B262|nr:ABC transporter ATP-binding protein [Methylicorpusculum sp.]MDO8843132.1 ABC transporter ATP-binding protein [Methylicorpusculum sp.]MDO8938219.1 ABC transporter ATP-binding protein [Methylicorpusculum sp.]MDO9239156.1 ABC transporter ATP-binding protein [Methylicorpusculum sp.]MDP2177409.1 ABC transporter ATP-binding protein [Methylicorpusculum sp.]MDP2202150.1 ABC transporter ATP-binding protein [Methylicorpusculum sp.]